MHHHDNNDDDPADSLDQGTWDLFKEPTDFFNPSKPCTWETFMLNDGRHIPLRLVGENPLWAHHLWNGAKVAASVLQKHRSTLVQNRSVLELGAGAGLPSLISAVLGARNVVVTDYPDTELIENLEYNISQCTYLTSASNIFAIPYLWGAPVDELLLKNALSNSDTASCSPHDCLFDTILLADVLFNHSEHRKLVRTIRLALARKADARALVLFTPYRPWLLDRDLAFFSLVQESHRLEDFEDVVADQRHAGGNGDNDSYVLGVNKVLEQTMDKVMFENDRGDERLRRTVFGYEIFWQDLQP